MMNRLMRFYYTAVGAILLMIMYFWYDNNELPHSWSVVIGYLIAMLLFGWADWLGKKLNANLP